MTNWLAWLAVGYCAACLCKAAMECDCNTEECLSLGLTTCFADKFCYAENFNKKLTRGCLDGNTPIMCENWRPKKLKNTHWPIVFCCNDVNFCNRDVKPTDPSDLVQATTNMAPADTYVDDDGLTIKKSDCENSETNRISRNTSGSKMLNPIYIAVPVAGVCVLLACILFAMYILRRRHDYYHHYHYQDHHAPHLAHPATDAKIPSATCGSVNRCTDSERSSSGSETKLFLQV